MVQTRIIPCLQLINDSLYKTVQFKNPSYIGDPINTVRIFNELEVDELCFLDIRASFEARQPNYRLLEEIANECFMPLSYGGGVSNIESVRTILSLGFEKIVLNTEALQNVKLVAQLSEYFGSQAVIGAIDVRKNFWGKYEVYTNSGTTKIGIDPIEYAKQLIQLGVGELLITSIDREGTWKGYDVTLIKKITEIASVPVIANGGAGEISHIRQAIDNGASAAALGSMVVYQKKDMGVLINYPCREVFNEIRK